MKSIRLGCIMFFRVMLFLYAACLTISCAHATVPVKVDKPQDPDIVSFKSTPANLFEGTFELTGRLKRPAGDGPFPAVVLLHGCGGIQTKRDHRWAERLTDWGYVTLQVDSFGPRGLSNVCTYAGNDQTTILQQRVTDAYDAARYLAGLPFVDDRKIAVMGWSHGGHTTLLALYQDRKMPFHAAVAFYPACRKSLSGMKVPLLILIGEADDWTPAAQCVIMMPKEHPSSEIILKIYPGAYHGFDTVDANHNVRGSRGMHHLQYDPEAEADAIIRVREFFQKHMKKD